MISIVTQKFNCGSEFSYLSSPMLLYMTATKNVKRQDINAV